MSKTKVRRLPSRPKKFIQIVPKYPLFAHKKMLATADYFRWPAEMMREKGYKPEIVTVTVKLKPWQKRKEVVNGIPVRRFRTTYGLLWHVARQDAFIHANLRPYPPSLLAALLPKPKVITTFTYVLSKNSLVNAFSLLLLRRFDKLLTASKYERDVYIKAGIPAEKAMFLPQPVDFSFFDKPKNMAGRRKYGVKENEFVIITVCGVRWIKRIDVLLKAFALAKKRLDPSKVFIVGEDSLHLENKPSVTEMAKELGIEKDVILTGEASSEEVRQILQFSDIYVNTSEVETQGIAACEAAAAGLPCCLSNVGSFKTMFENAALYHTPTNPEQLAANILKYRNNKELMKRNAKKAKELVRRDFEFKKVKAATLKVYEEAIRKHYSNR